MKNLLLVVPALVISLIFMEARVFAFSQDITGTMVCRDGNLYAQVCFNTRVSAADQPVIQILMRTNTTYSRDSAAPLGSQQRFITAVSVQDPTAQDGLLRATTFPIFSNDSAGSKLLQNSMTSALRAGNTLSIQICRRMNIEIDSQNYLTLTSNQGDHEAMSNLPESNPLRVLVQGFRNIPASERCSDPRIRQFIQNVQTDVISNLVLPSIPTRFGGSDPFSNPIAFSIENGINRQAAGPITFWRNFDLSNTPTVRVIRSTAAMQNSTPSASTVSTDAGVSVSDVAAYTSGAGTAQ